MTSNTTTSAPDGTPWCTFRAGSTKCIYGDQCDNLHNHQEDWDDMADFNRDGFGRALITLPGDDKPTPHTRATTVAKVLDDQYHLGMWKARMVAFGLSRYRHLVDLAAAAESPDDKRVLADVVEQALQMAGGSEAANLGTALHGLTQQLDLGSDPIIPEHWKVHIARYETLTTAFGVKWAWIEVPLVLPDILVAGTADRIDEAGIVWDLKTSKSLSFSEVSIAQQLAIYSRAKYRYDDGRCVEAPEMNQDEGRVIWLPVKGDVAKVFKVDIDTGWQLVQRSLDVREARKIKGLFEEIEAPEPASLPATPEEEPSVAPYTTVTLDTVKARVVKIVDAGHVNHLKALWPDSIPTLKEGGLTDDQLATINKICEATEDKFGMPL